MTWGSLAVCIGSSCCVFCSGLIWLVDTRIEPMKEFVIGSFGVTMSDYCLGLNLFGLSDTIETESSSAISLKS